MSQEGLVRTLTLNRPERRNALDQGLIDALVRNLRDCEADPGVRAVVLAGAPPAFCAGLDLDDIRSGSFDWATLTSVERSPWAVLAELGVPVIAAVNGPAITGGLELALACDVRVAGPLAVFADTHVRLGLHPAGGLTSALPAIVGQGRALEMSLTGRLIDAGEALRIGLVSEIADDGAVLELAHERAAAIAAAPPEVLALVRSTYRGNKGRGHADALCHERRQFALWRDMSGRGPEAP